MFEYYGGGERRINDSIKPLTRAESHFADARFFEEDDTLKETMPASITSLGNHTTKNVIQLPKADAHVHQLQKEENQLGGTTFSAKQKIIKVPTTSESSPIVLRYMQFLSLDERRDSRRLQNVQLLKALLRQMAVIAWLIRPSSGRMVYFHCTKHAKTRLSQHLPLI